MAMMRRFAAALVVLILAVGFVHAQPAAALPGLPDPCDLAPSGPLQDACHLANPLTPGAVGTAVGVTAGAVNTVTNGVASGIFDQALTWMSSILAGTVKSAMEGLGAVMTSTPAPPIDQGWFTATYAPLMVAGIGMCVFVLIFHLIANMIRFRTAEMGRCFIMFLGAVFLTATAPLFILMGLQFADALTAGFASWGGPQAGQLVDKITDITSTITTTGGLGAVQPLLVILVLMFAVVLVIVWSVLLIIRSMILYIGTLAIPFVLPSIIDGKARLARIYFKTMFGVIVAKPILVGTLVFGAMLLKQGYVDQQGIVPLLDGIAILLIATLLPLAVFKFLLPATAPVVALVERGAGKVVGGAKTATMAAAGAVTGGAAGAAMGAAASGGMTPKQPPPRPRTEAPAPTPPRPSGGTQ